MIVKYIKYFNEMLQHIKLGNQLSIVSKKVGRKHGVASDLIYLAHKAGYIKPTVEIGKYTTTINKFTRVEVEKILIIRTNKQEESKRKKSLLEVGDLYIHPNHGLVKIDDIFSESSVMVIPVDSESMLSVGVQTRMLKPYDPNKKPELTKLDKLILKKKEDKSKIVEVIMNDYKAGKPMTDIHKTHRISPTKLSTILSSTQDGKTLRELYKEERVSNKVIDPKHLIMLECVNNGEKVADIAKKFGVNKSVISIVAKNNGICIGAMRKSLREEKCVELITDLKSSMTEVDIRVKYPERQFYVTIRNHFKLVEKQRKVSERDKKLVSLYKEGYTLSNIADLLGLGIPTIAALVRKNKAYKYENLSISIADKKKKMEVLYDHVAMLRDTYKMNPIQISEELNATGYRNLRGAEYNVIAVYGILHNIVDRKPKSVVKKTRQKPLNDYLSQYLKKRK